MFSALYMREHCELTYKKVISILDRWPTTGEKWVNEARIVKWVDEWEIHIKTVKDYHNLAVFASVNCRCLSDISIQVQDPVKVALVDEIRDDIERIHDFVDFEGLKFDIYEKVEELIVVLYKIIEWEWKVKCKVVWDDEKWEKLISNNSASLKNRIREAA